MSNILCLFCPRRKRAGQQTKQPRSQAIRLYSAQLLDDDGYPVRTRKLTGPELAELNRQRANRRALAECRKRLPDNGPEVA